MSNGATWPDRAGEHVDSLENTLIRSASAGEQVCGADQVSRRYFEPAPDVPGHVRADLAGTLGEQRPERRRVPLCRQIRKPSSAPAKSGRVDDLAAQVGRTCLVGARTARTTGSTGRPRSALHATLTPRMSRVSSRDPAGSDSAQAAARREPAVPEGRVPKCREQQATSATVRPIGPSTPASRPRPCHRRGRDPAGRRAQPDHVAEARRVARASRPGRCRPRARASGRRARPPHPRCCRRAAAGSYGFLVAPNTGLTVCDPATNSGVFVFPQADGPGARHPARR